MKIEISEETARYASAAIKGTLDMPFNADTSFIYERFRRAEIELDEALKSPSEKKPEKKREQELWKEYSIDELVDAEFAIFRALRFNEMCDGEALTEPQVKRLLATRYEIKAVINENRQGGTK